MRAGVGKLLDIPPEEVPAAVTPTSIHVIAGGPCSGKTTLLEALAALGYRTERETAEELLKAGVAAGRTPEEMREDPVAWQEHLFQQDFSLFSRLARAGLVFTDTSFLETLVFTERAGITVGPHIERWAERLRYARVFFLEPLQDYRRTPVRREDQATAAAISREARACYQRFGYRPLTVPPGTVAERVAFVLETIG